MENDDVMPNDGTFFGGVPREPLEQVISRKKEKAQTLEVKAELERIIQHFEDRVKATDSIQHAMAVAEEYEVSKETALIVMDMVCKQLEDERRMIEELLDIHSRR